MFSFLTLSFLLLPSFSRIVVYSPEDMRERFVSKYAGGEIPSSLGNFGNPPYGTSFVGPVFYPSLYNEQDGCVPLTPIPFAADEDHSNSPILLLDRGTCAFVVKVRHAEDIGARLVLIANNVDSDISSIIMTDNGLGGNLKIPALLISQEDAQIIKDFLREKQHTTLSISFEMKQAVNRVKFDFFTSPTIEECRTFLFDFSAAGSKMKVKDVDFYPHYLLWTCPSCAGSSYQIDHEHCVSGGRYCSLDPDGNGDRTGRDVMYEDLRQLCIYQQARSSSDYSLWFRYQSEYFSQCSMELFVKECSEKVMSMLKISPSAIQQCVDNSFESDDQIRSDNRLLKSHFDYLRENLMPFYPSIVINEQIYRGDLEADAVYSALCAGFAYEHMPEYCKGKSGDNDTESKSGKGSWLLILTIVVCVVMAVAALVLCRTLIRKDMNRDVKAQVNNAVAQYFQLAERT
jgi:hypothetical protein